MCPPVSANVRSHVKIVWHNGNNNNNNNNRRISISNVPINIPKSKIQIGPSY